MANMKLFLPSNNSNSLLLRRVNLHFTIPEIRIFSSLNYPFLIKRSLILQLNATAFVVSKNWNSTIFVENVKPFFAKNLRWNVPYAWRFLSSLKTFLDIIYYNNHYDIYSYIQFRIIIFESIPVKIYVVFEPTKTELLIYPLYPFLFIIIQS